MRACGNGFLEKIFFAPERLTPVYHGLCLGAQAEEKDGRGQNNPVCSANRLINLRHVIIVNTDAGFIASPAVLAWHDVHFIQREKADIRS